MVYLAQRQTTQVHQIIAVIGSLLGIVLGKYFLLSYTVEENLAYIFDKEVFTYFQENLRESFDLIDLVFAALAVITAWRMTGRMATSGCRATFCC